MQRSADGSRGALSPDAETYLLAHARRGLADLETGLRTDLGLEVPQAQQAAKLITESFTAESFVGFPCGAHVMGFGWGGLWLQEALDIASLLEAAHRATGAVDETVNRLGRGQSFMGARSELRAVRVLDERGHRVELSKTREAGADLRILGADDARVEVVTFDAPPRDASVELAFHMTLVNTEPRPRDHRIDVFVTLRGDRIAAIAAHRRADERVARALAVEMAAALRPAIEAGEDAVVDVPGIGSAIVRRWRGRPATPGGWHVERNPPVSTAKKMVSAIHNKAAQTESTSSHSTMTHPVAVSQSVIWVDLSPLRFHAGALGPRDLLEAMHVHACDALAAGAYEHVAGVVLYATEWVDDRVLLERFEPVAGPCASHSPSVFNDLLDAPSQIERTVVSLARSLRP